MNDEAIFQIDARGPGGSEYCSVRWHKQQINAAILTWTAPNGHVLTPLVVLRCPLCDFPIAARPDISAQCEVEQGDLTLRQFVRCPGHWPQVDDNGNIVTDPSSGRPKRITCSWQVVIIGGQAHTPSCGAAARSPSKCSCVLVTVVPTL